jgi:ATP-dependent Clp protease ATP-binding subunit ClpC
MFDLKKAAIYQALKWEKWPAFRFGRFLSRLFLILFLIVFLLFFYGFVLSNFPGEISRKLLGFSMIFLVCSLLVRLEKSFFDLKLKKPKLKATLAEAALNPEKYNLAEFLEFEAAKAVFQALKFRSGREVGSTHILFFLLRDNPKIRFIFSRLLLDFKEVFRLLGDAIKNSSFLEYPAAKTSESLEEIIRQVLERADKRNHSRITLADILSVLTEKDFFFKRILTAADLKPEDVGRVSDWLEDTEREIEKRKRFWERENLAKKGTLAKEWTAGYTITLDKYSVDLTERLKKKDFEIFGHQKELELAERILAQTKINNVLIIGRPGTGKRSIVYGLIRKSLLGQSLPAINYKRVVELNMEALLAQIEDAEKVEFVLDRIFQEATRAGNVILLIDEFHNYVGRPGQPGLIDISAIIAPYLRFSQFQLIAITTYEGLHQYIEKDSSFLDFFKKVEVSEIPTEETLKLLERLTYFYENRYKIFISYPALRQIIDLSRRYFPSAAFPEKALDVLDAVAVYAARSIKDRIVRPKDVAKIISEKSEIPVGEIGKKEKAVLLNLESLIHQRVVNQEEAVKDVAAALRRARAEVSFGKRPMGTFLFLGPTGVGKTETAKALAECYFGSEEKIIRLDMSEFQAIKDIQRLIGSQDRGGILTDKVRENPFSLVLLDEIEKAHPDILNLFLQVLDEGYLTDGRGRKVSFQNTIIIATGNAGYKVILEALKSGTEWLKVKEKLLNELFEKRIFRPEFVNRFDAFVVFKPLSRKNLLDIADLIMSRLKKNFEKKGIEFVISPGLKKKIVELSYNPVFGAREMKRVVQNKVENVLAGALLTGELKKGERVEIEPKDFSLIIK